MSATKIGGNTTNILNCYFQNKFTLWHIRLNIYIWKTKFTSNKQYFSGHLFSRNAKKTHTDQSILLTFLFYLKINVSRTFKRSSCKKLFPKLVYHWCNLLRWIFFIPCDNCKQYFFSQINRYPEAWCNRHVAVFFQTSVLKEVRILCPLSPQYYDDVDSKNSK